MILNVLRGVVLVIACGAVGAAFIQLPFSILAHFGIYFFGEGILLLPLTGLAMLIGFLAGLVLSIKLAQR